MYENALKLTLTLSLVAGLASCKSAPETVPDAAPASAPASAPEAAEHPAAKPEPTGLKTVYNGEEIPFQNFIVYSYGGLGLRGELSTHTPTCEDFQGGGRGLAEGEQYLSFAISPRLEPEGLTTWKTISFNFGRHGKLDDADSIGVVPGTAPEDMLVKFALVQDWKEDEFLRRPAGRLEMTGSIKPTYCGVIAKDKDAASRPQAGLEVTLGAHKVSVEGASIVWKDDELVLRLTSQPHSCLIDAIGTDAYITLKAKREGLVPTSMVVSGDLFGNGTINYGMEASEAKIALEGEPTEAGQAMGLTLHKASDVPIKIEGSLVAEICE